MLLSEVGELRWNINPILRERGMSFEYANDWIWGEGDPKVVSKKWGTAREPGVATMQC